MIWGRGYNFILLHVNIQLSQHHLLKILCVPYWIVLALLSKSINHKCQAGSLDVQSYSTDLFAYPYASAMLSGLLEIWVRSEIRKDDFANFCSSFSGLFRSFWFLCIFLWISGSALHLYKERQPEFERDHIDSADQLGKYGHLSNINCSNSKPGNVFLLI